MGRLVGIDLGTTNSVVAVVSGSVAEVVARRGREPHMPSVVSLRRTGDRDAPEGELVVGDPARDNALLAPADTIVSIKRLMGRGFGDAEVQRLRATAGYEIVQPRDGTPDGVRVVIAGGEHSPVAISQRILAALVEQAAEALGEPVTHTVIAVPAYFSQVQRAATREAALLAGIRVIGLIDEPTAAAMAFRQGLPDPERPRTIVVYDLGGGTFDVVVLMAAGGGLAPLATEGDMWLGGDDFDQAIVKRAIAAIASRYGLDPGANHRFMAALRAEAQRVKEELSASESAELAVPGAYLQDAAGNDVDVRVRVTREWFDKAVAPLVERTIELTRKALDEAGVGLDDVDHVVLAGNATAMPCVRRAVAELVGADKMVLDEHPKHCVAMGAALLATAIGPYLICDAPDPDDPSGVRTCGHVNREEDVRCERCRQPLDRLPGDDEPNGGEHRMQRPARIAPFPYGVQSAGDAFNVFVEKGEPYPTQSPRTMTFTTRLPGQRLISIPVYGGEDVHRASANAKEGDVLAVLPAGLPAGTDVRIGLGLDGDGVFVVTARLEDGTYLPTWQAKETIALFAERLAAVNQTVAAGSANAERRDEVERLRDEILDDIRRGAFADASGKAVALGKLLGPPGDDVAHGADQDAKRRLEGIIGYTEAVLWIYSESVSGRQKRVLRRLVEYAKEAVANGDDVSRARCYHELDVETDALPQPVIDALTIRQAIDRRIAPREPVLARQLDEELLAVQAALRSKARTADDALSALNDSVVEAAKRLTASPRRPCPHCTLEVPAGTWMCPHCSKDTFVLDPPTRGRPDDDDTNAVPTA